MMLYVTNMFSRRCKTIVESEFQKVGLYGVADQPGEVRIDRHPTPEQYEQLKKSLLNLGFIVLDDNNAEIIDLIKFHIEERIQNPDKYSTIKFSVYLEKMLLRDYTFLSNLFSRVKQITIEQYIIASRIEFAKELLLYEGINLTEISYRMDYSSVAYLSRQFRKITGTTPSRFKQCTSNFLKLKRQVFHFD